MIVFSVRLVNLRFVRIILSVAKRKIELGPTGVTVAHNIRRLREARRLGHTALSQELADAGRDIAPLGLRRIETGDRRVDVDDLLALAAALEVPPNILLMPDVADGEVTVAATGIGKQKASGLWNWLVGVRPREGQSDTAFLATPWPAFLQREREKEARAALKGLSALFDVEPTDEGK
jgi:transcriptional regulator with XRE-family HTH domain